MTDYIDPACQFVTAQAKLATYSLNIIKLYTNLKDKTEKESVDPLSSLTSALSKTPKNDISLFHINFSPVPDAYWRTESKLAILGSDAPNWKKRVLMHSPWIVRFFVMIPGWIWKFFQFLFGLKKESGVDTASEKTEPSLEQKQYQYGYRMQITIAKESREASRDTRFLRELASALNIFSEPHGNRFILGDTKQMSRLELTTHIPKKTDILNIAELAGLVHLPTVYVRTPGVNWVTTRKFEPPHDLPPAESPNTPIGTSNFRGLTEGF